MTKSLKQPLKWAALTVASVIMVACLEFMRLPVAQLLGPMIAAVAFAVGNANMRLPPMGFGAAQVVIGFMMAKAFPVSIFVQIAHNWIYFFGAVFLTLGASALLGWLLARYEVLPGSAAIWGISPGAASAMVLMAESYGADIRLVAFMQYLRVAVVSGMAAIVVRIWLAPGSAAVHETHWFAAPDWPRFLPTLLLIAVCCLASPIRRIPAGLLLAPIAIGAALQDTGTLKIELPPLLLALAYFALGWGIGLRFTRQILVSAVRAFPSVLASILCLIAVCVGIAVLLVVFVDVDPMTAYLATSPGGADVVAIIAISSKVDAPFVMAMQTARLLLVVFLGPMISRFFADRVARPGLTGYV